MYIYIYIMYIYIRTNRSRPRWRQQSSPACLRGTAISEMQESVVVGTAISRLECQRVCVVVTAETERERARARWGGRESARMRARQ